MDYEKNQDEDQGKDPSGSRDDLNDQHESSSLDIDDEAREQAGFKGSSSVIQLLKRGWRRFRDWFEWIHVVRLAAAMAILFFFVLLTDQIVMPLYTKQGKEVILPEVEGLKRGQADSILTEGGFRVIMDREIHSRAIPRGIVISQNPLPQSIVKRGRRIYLTISKGEKWVKVPQLIGQSERNAQELLRQMELVPETEYEFSSLFPKGVVYEQSIAPDDSASVGDTVRFIISLGDIPENLIVPAVIGKSLSEARRILIRTGLQIGSVTYQVNDDLLPQTVIQQSIPADSLVDVGEPIDLIISTITDESEEDIDP